jgi:GLPGLI family protein
MNKIIFLKFLLLLSLHTLGQQNINVSYIFKIQPKDLSISGASFFKILKVNEYSSIFLDSGIGKTNGQKGLIQSTSKLDKGFYFDKVKDKSVYFQPIFGKDFYVQEDSMITLFHWKLLDTIQKKILEFDCKAASCTFRGREYIAYYTESIQTSSGPWKFCGLPGLILEVSSSDNMYSFSAFKIFVEKNQEKIINPYENINLKFISFAEHKKLFLKKLMDSQNKFNSENKDGDDTKINDNSIELLK